MATSSAQETAGPSQYSRPNPLPVEATSRPELHLEHKGKGKADNVSEVDSDEESNIPNRSRSGRIHWNIGIYDRYFIVEYVAGLAPEQYCEMFDVEEDGGRQKLAFRIQALDKLLEVDDSTPEPLRHRLESARQSKVHSPFAITRSSLT